MSISKTQQQRRRQAAIDLAKKLKLEVSFSRSMRSFFNTVRKDFRSRYVSSKPNVIASEYKIDLTAALKQQYRKIAKEFSGYLEKDLNKNFQYEIKQGEKEEIEAEILGIIAAKATIQSEYIIQTTQKEIDQAVTEVLQTTDDLTDQEIAKRASAILQSRQAARSDIIAATEVNSMAEETKFTEFAVLAAAGIALDGEPLSEKVVKRWDAVLDEKTRINHAVADGQQRNKNDTFLIGGQSLMFPGDTSHGATLDNVINCRCSVQYVTGRPTVL
jgi:hypothetical protein